ncbi:hypothetical protein [Sphaerisporangium sp. NPDC051011]|uniref:hypothetical protein n=1 Tax=Sphaerisporangium sp. NPDC051011 TaxID=3155792 RepID=UPI0034085810
MFQDPGQRAARQAQQEHQRQVNQRFSDTRPARPGGCLSFLVLVALALAALGWAGAHGYTPSTIIRDIQHFVTTPPTPDVPGDGSGG